MRRRREDSDEQRELSRQRIGTPTLPIRRLHMENSPIAPFINVSISFFKTIEFCIISVIHNITIYIAKHLNSFLI